jgi:hypothetical protein
MDQDVMEGVAYYWGFGVVKITRKLIAPPLLFTTKENLFAGADESLPLQ